MSRKQQGRDRTGGPWWVAARGLAVLTLLASAAAAMGAAPLDVPLLFVQEPLEAESKEHTKLGNRIVRLEPDGGVVVLTGEFAGAMDPCVSFDAERFLFAGKRTPTDPWDIWEMDVEGSRWSRVTEGEGDCREPIYLPPAAVDSPDFRNKVGWITFTSTKPGVLNDLADAPLTSLYAMSLEPIPGRGNVFWRTTNNLGGDICPTLLSDGRVLFSARQRGAFGLMTISWAGENLNPFYGSHDGGISQIEPCELPDRTVLFVEQDEAFRERGGRLARVAMTRPLHSRAVASPEGERYRTPQVLPDGRVLVSSASETSFGIFLFDVDLARRGALVYDDPQWHEVDPVPVVSRPTPPGRIPTVEFASVLDVGTLEAAGQLQCLNVYDTDRPWEPESAPGSVATVRFVQGIPRPLPEVSAMDAASPDSTWPPPGVNTRVLGEAPVERDGSFYVNVPGDVPFYLELLDGEGRAVQTMRAWLWVRAGDQRGCVGCHEDKELAPENRATEALIRAQPVTLSGPPADPRTALEGGS